MVPQPSIQMMKKENMALECPRNGIFSMGKEESLNKTSTEVSQNGGSPKSSESLDRFSTETNGFGDPPF